MTNSATNERQERAREAIGAVLNRYSHNRAMNLSGGYAEAKRIRNQCVDEIFRVVNLTDEHAGEVVRLREALEAIRLTVEDEAYKVVAGQPLCKHIAALNEVHEYTRAALNARAAHHTDEVGT